VVSTFFLSGKALFEDLLLQIFVIFPLSYRFRYPKISPFPRPSRHFLISLFQCTITFLVPSLFRIRRVLICHTLPPFFVLQAWAYFTSAAISPRYFPSPFLWLSISFWDAFSSSLFLIAALASRPGLRKLPRFFPPKGHFFFSSKRLPSFPFPDRISSFHAA